MKRVLALVLMAAMTVSLMAGCGSKPAASDPATSASAASTPATSTPATSTPADSSSTEEPIKATAVLLMAGSAAWGTAKTSLERAFEKNGWEGEVLAPAVALDEEEMIKFAENAISSGSDILITTCRHGDMWVDTCNRAHDAGMLVIGLGVKPDRFNLSEPYKNEDLNDGFIGADIEEVARLEARKMNEVIPEGEPVNAIMFYPEVNDAAKLCWDAIIDEFSQLRPDAKFHSIQADGNDAAQVADKLSAVRLQDPTVNVVFGMGAFDAVGLHTYIVENNLQGKIYSCGVDCSPETLATVKAGTVSFLIDQGYASYGDAVVEMANKLLAGEPIEWDYPCPYGVVDQSIVEEWSVEHGFGEVPEL